MDKYYKMQNTKYKANNEILVTILNEQLATPVGTRVSMPMISVGTTNVIPVQR